MLLPWIVTKVVNQLNLLHHSDEEADQNDPPHEEDEVSLMPSSDEELSTGRSPDRSAVPSQSDDGNQSSSPERVPRKRKNKRRSRGRSVTPRKANHEKGRSTHKRGGKGGVQGHKMKFDKPLPN